MNNTEELKPCPFCGGEVKLKFNVMFKSYSILCDREPCLHSGLIREFNAENKRNAIKAWNTRPQEHIELLKELRGSLEVLKIDTSLGVNRMGIDWYALAQADIDKINKLIGENDE